MMGVKLLWTGLTLTIAALPFLKALGLAGSDSLVLGGAIVMVIGLVLYWMDK
jgi:hypothetical protein